MKLSCFYFLSRAAHDLVDSPQFSMFYSTEMFALFSLQIFSVEHLTFLHRIRILFPDLRLIRKLRLESEVVKLRLNNVQSQELRLF